jgi:hypothetical protein
MCRKSPVPRHVALDRLLAEGVLGVSRILQVYTVDVSIGAGERFTDTHLKLLLSLMIL